MFLGAFSKEFSYERGDMCYFAYIRAKVLKYFSCFNVVFCWRAITQKNIKKHQIMSLLKYWRPNKNSNIIVHKIKNFSANVGKITHITPLI